MAQGNNLLFSLNKNKTTVGLTGLDFGPHGIVAAHITRRPERRGLATRPGAHERPPVLDYCEYYPYAGCDDVQTLLKNISRNHNLKHARCTTALEQQGYKLLLTDAPAVNDDELRSAMRWKIKDLVNIPEDNLTLDTIRIPQPENSSAPAQVYVVAAKNDVVQKAVSQITSAGINLQIIDIVELAQRNIATLLADDAHGVALLRINKHDGILTITRGGELYLCRHLSVSGEFLLDTTTRDEAIASMLLEIQRTLDFYQSHFRMPAIKHLAVAPLPEQMPDLLEQIRSSLGVSAELLDLGTLIECRQPLPLAEQHRYFTAIGAALRKGSVTA
ncbi:MAG: pilus assembly protein PilM [Gammaproteobacteria bacterium]|nr:pilus assembly protein PilM [Gammaproteobacteria bacterium]